MDKYKHYAFQYGDDRCMIEDKSLIDKDEADTLWREHYQSFIQNVVKGNRPEMAIWVGMNNEGDYHTKARYLHGDDCIVQDSILYVRN